MKVVVSSATGAQGGAIAQAFRASGYLVTGLTRNQAPGASWLQAVDTANEDAIAIALEGADVLVFTPPIDFREGAREQLAERFVRAAERAGVARVVVNTGAITPENFHKPAAASIRAVQGAFLSSSLRVAVIQPSVYMDNLLQDWALGALRDGVLPYPAPKNARISWVSHRDLGAFAVAAVGYACGEGRIFRIGGPERLSGDEVAQALSVASGREVIYQEVPLDVFAEQANAVLGAPAGDNIADFYRHLHTDPLALTRDEAASNLLGVEAESFLTWAKRQRWA